MLHVSSSKDGLDENKLIGWKRFSAVQNCKGKLLSRIFCWFGKCGLTSSMALVLNRIQRAKFRQIFANNLKIRPIKITYGTTPGDLSFDTFFAEIPPAVSEEICG